MMSKKQAGRKGGRATFARYGREHMQAIGKRGARTTWTRYRLSPIGTNNFALVDRQTNQIKTTLLDWRK